MVEYSERGGGGGGQREISAHTILLLLRSKILPSLWDSRIVGEGKEWGELVAKMKHQAMSQYLPGLNSKLY